MPLLNSQLRGRSGSLLRTSARYTAGAPSALTVSSVRSSDGADIRISDPRQTIVVKPGGALLRTRSVTGPFARSSSPSRADPPALLALNSNEGAEATPSIAV